MGRRARALRAAVVPPACHYAGQRDHCEGVAVVSRGPIPLCQACQDRASSLTRLPAGPVVDPRYVRPPAPHPATSLQRRQGLAPQHELVAVRRARERVETRQAVAVENARTAGMTWAEIGHALGLDGSTVFRRYSGASAGVTPG